MKRQTDQLHRQTYDLVIIGGGIFGACAAWDAARRGLTVALLEKADFCQATSAHHFKMIHGGMRYLQHLDIKRVRESSRERSILLRIAPHLAQPLPILMPTYGHGLKGKEILRAGLALYELLTTDRNNHIADPARKIPASRILSRKEVLKEFPGTLRGGLTGGVIFYDGQIYNPTRLVLAFIRSAVEAGADAANYLEVTDLIKAANKVTGVKVRDTLSGDRFSIRCRFVLNAAGPWAHRLNAKFFGRANGPVPSFSRDLVMVVPKKLHSNYAFAAMAQTRDKDALIDRGGRHLFIIPWRRYSIVGVWHKYYSHGPDQIAFSDNELAAFIHEINQAYHHIDLKLDDVCFVNTGLILFGTQGSQGGVRNHSFGKRSLLIDHAVTDKVDGMISLIGVRATIARKDAKTTIDQIVNRLGKKASPSDTHAVPLFGGKIDDIARLTKGVQDAYGGRVSSASIAALIRNFGAAYGEVLKTLDEAPRWAEPLNGTETLQAEIVHAVREEMALKLGDSVFRRTELGTGSDPGKEALRICAELMAHELGWDRQRTEQEVVEVESIFANRGPWTVVNHSETRSNT